MIKVLILGPSLKLRGGVTNYLKLLISNLEKKKFQVKYFAHGRIPKRWKNIFLPFIIIKQLIEVKILLQNYRPSIVHINPSLAWLAIWRDFLFLRIVKANGFPVLIFFRGWRENISKKFGKLGFWQLYFKKRLKRADAIVVLAKQFKENLLDLGINPDKIFISSTMVEFSKYFHEYKKFTRPYKILMCGYLKKEKGPYELLEAASKIIKKFPDTKFVFVGKGEELTRLKQKTKKMKLENNVEFTGYKSGDEKINIFREAHIFAFPSYSEGFPTVILEAMAAGAALVSTSVGGLDDALKDGKNGLIIKSMPPQPEEIAEKIIQLFKNPKLMKKMSKNNVLEAKEKYDVKILSKEIGKIYEHIISHQ